MPVHFDAGLDLLDRHVVDCDGHPIGKVDDLEIDAPGAGRAVGREPLTVTALLVGPEAWGRRLGGPIGRCVSGAARRLGSHPVVIPVGLVEDFGVVIRLSVPIDRLEGAARLEHWLRDRFVRRIPGGRRATP